MFSVVSCVNNSRTQLCLAGLLLLLALTTGRLNGAEVENLYTATVTVNSRDSEQERRQAFTAGMRQILLKLTGRQDVLNNAVIRQALNNAQPYVETWAYNSSSALNPGTPERITLQVAYYQSEIQRLLNDSSVPIWPVSRPVTIVWLVMQDELGGPSLAGTAGASAEAIYGLLRQSAELRGVPLLLPLMDFNDLSAISADQLWSFDHEVLRSASARYNTDSILALRVVRLLNGEVIARAEHLFRERSREIEVIEGELDPFLTATIGMVAEELAANYAILLSGSGNSSEVQLHVEGINTLKDYAGLLAYLNGLTVVKSVQVMTVDGPRLELQLGTGGQFRQLIENLALDRRLLPLAEPVRNNNIVSMRYVWQSR